MIKKCDRCGKPLTEFEVSFHEKAGSPSAISSKCWVCSGAEMQFMDGYVDKPHHRVEIFVCLLTVAIIVALCIPLVPYLDSYSLPTGLEIYSYALVVIYFALGTLATYIIRHRKGKKPEIREFDPPMTRYQHTYGPNTDIYTTRIDRAGKFVTTKETRLGGSVDDKWGAHASSGSDTLDRISGFYGKLIYAFLVPCIYLLVGGTFIFWVLPYILIMSLRDRHAKGKTANVPKELGKAYRHCRELYGESPITYDDKAGYLVSKDQHKTKKAESTNSFLAHYTSSASDDSAPFFYTRKNGVSYMIVEYNRPQNKNYGVTFLLACDGSGEIKRRIVVGNGLLPADPHNWEKDWHEMGVSQYTMQHLAWYEEKMRSIMKSGKKNSEIVG